MLCDSPTLLLPPTSPLFSHCYRISTQFSPPLQVVLVPFICPTSISVSCPLSSIDAIPACPLWELLPLSTGWYSFVSLYHRSRFWPQSVLLGIILNSSHPFLLFPVGMGNYLPCGAGGEQAMHGEEVLETEARWREAAALKAWCCKSSSAGRCLEQCVCTSVPWSLGRSWREHFAKATKFPQARLHAPQLQWNHIGIWGHRGCSTFESCLWWNLAGSEFVMAVLSPPSLTAWISIEWPQTSSELWNQCTLH